MRSALSLVAVLVLFGCAAPPKAPESPERESITTGAELAQARCSQCHAVGASGESPNPNAPPFRTIGTRYSLGVLQEELINGVHVGVAEMPQFSFTIRESDALNAYLRSIQRTPQPDGDN